MLNTIPVCSGSCSVDVWFADCELTVLPPVVTYIGYGIFGCPSAYQDSKSRAKLHRVHLTSWMQINKHTDPSSFFAGTFPCKKGKAPVCQLGVMSFNREKIPFLSQNRFFPTIVSYSGLTYLILILYSRILR